MCWPPYSFVFFISVQSDFEPDSPIFQPRYVGDYFGYTVMKWFYRKTQYFIFKNPRWGKCLIESEQNVSFCKASGNLYFPSSVEVKKLITLLVWRLWTFQVGLIMWVISTGFLVSGDVLDLCVGNEVKKCI